MNEQQIFFKDILLYTLMIIYQKIYQEVINLEGDISRFLRPNSELNLLV